MNLLDVYIMSFYLLLEMLYCILTMYSFISNISTESLIMSSKYNIPYRKDRTNHGGGLLKHLSCELAHTQVKV